MSNGKWYWHSRGFGGYNSLDYLIKVEGMGFVDAVETLTGKSAPVYPQATAVKSRASPPKRPFKLPEANRNNDRVYVYLRGRGISKELIHHCIQKGLLYESARTHRCVFVGKAGDVPKFACERGTRDSWKRDITGSDKRFNFHLPPLRAGRESLAVFEGAVDVLAHVEVCRLEKSPWDGYRLSLGGTSPRALTSFLERHPQIKNIQLCLDNDDAGKTAAKRIIEELGKNERFSHLQLSVKLPTAGKDYADALAGLQQQNIPQPPRRCAGIVL